MTKLNYVILEWAVCMHPYQLKSVCVTLSSLLEEVQPQFYVKLFFFYVFYFLNLSSVLPCISPASKLGYKSRWTKKQCISQSCSGHTHFLWPCTSTVHFHSWANWRGFSISKASYTRDIGIVCCTVPENIHGIIQLPQIYSAFPCVFP